METIKLLLTQLTANAYQAGWSTVHVDAAVSLIVDRVFSDVGRLKTEDLIEQLLSQKTYPDELAKDIARERIFKALTTKHFQLALREARRNDTRTRFVWSVGGGQLRLLMPRSLVGAERREWLERNIQAVDPTRPGERERVQAIVDGLLGTAPISIDAENAPALTADIPHPEKALDRIDSQSLGECVAQEKADSLPQLRPAVRKLGPRKVNELVQTIFERIDQGDYHEGEVAKDFGLDAATFSRFAGGRWKASGRVPDLWRNLAGLLASHERFVHLCQDAGVWNRIQSIVTPPANV